MCRITHRNKIDMAIYIYIYIYVIYVYKRIYIYRERERERFAQSPHWLRAQVGLRWKWVQGPSGRGHKCDTGPSRM